MADVAGSIGQEIINLERKWVEAGSRRDAATRDSLLGDDFLIAGWLPNGRLGYKQLYVEDCLRPIDVSGASYGFHRWEIRAYGDAVVANCLFECHAVVAGREWGAYFL